MNAPARPNVYLYDDPALFLRDWIRAMPVPLTQRQFAEAIGLQSRSTLPHLLSGYRKVHPDMIQPIVQLFELNAGESRFFEVLVQYSRSKKADQRQQFFEEMHRMRVRTNCFQLDLRHHVYFSSWYFAPLLELIYMRSIRYEDAGTMGRMLKPSIGSQDAKRAVERLIQLGLCDVDENGLLRHHRKIIRADGIPASILRNLKSEYLQLAAQSQDRFAMSDRSITGLTMALSPANYQLATQKMDELREWLLQLRDQEGAADRVVHFSLAAYPLTRLEGDEDDE